MVKIIGFGGEKGGCGKTTMATNTAALCASRGYKTALLDTDEKPDSFDWWKLRSAIKENAPPPITCKRTVGDIDDSIIALANDHDFVIIDTAGMDGPEMRYTIAYSHIFIAPFNPSRYDLNSAEKVQSLVALGRPVNPDLKTHSLLVNCSNHKFSKSRQAARESLDRTSMLTCLHACMHSLEVWKTTAETGLGVSELNNPKAIRDINEFAEEIGLWK